MMWSIRLGHMDHVTMGDVEQECIGVIEQVNMGDVEQKAIGVIEQVTMGECGARGYRCHGAGHYG